MESVLRLLNLYLNLIDHMIHFISFHPFFLTYLFNNNKKKKKKKNKDLKIIVLIINFRMNYNNK